MSYRHHNRGGIDFASEPKRRRHSDVISEHTEVAIKDHLDVAELICPLCKKHLIHEHDFYHCYWCGLTTEVVLVVNRRLADNDPRRLSLRLLQREGTLTLKAWLHAGENHGFFVSFLPCPWCKDPITHLIEHDTGARTSCCHIAFIPQIIEIPTPKPPRGKRIQRWKVSYRYEKVVISSPTVCELKVMDIKMYQSELAHFAPKVETIGIEADPTASEAPSDDSEVSETQKLLTEELIVTGIAATDEFIRRFVGRDPGAIIPQKHFYQAYVKWIKEQHQEPLGNKTFYKQLREVFPYLECRQNRINGPRVWCYRGISLRSESKVSKL